MEDVISHFHKLFILDVKMDFEERKKYSSQEILGFKVIGMRVSWNGKMWNGVVWKWGVSMIFFCQNNLHYLYIEVGKGVSHKSLASTFSESDVYCNYKYSHEFQSIGQF